MDNGLMRIEEVAALLRLSPRRVAIMCREKTIPSCRVGRFVRVPAKALDCYLTGKTEEALASARAAKPAA